MVTLYGRGAKVEMKIANKSPHSLQALMFEIQEKHLAECENIKRLQHKLQTGLTLRRTFVAKNTGELPFTVTNMTINGVNCVNRGFRILNCFQFTLKPNESYELDVAFTPDFTLSWYDATLHVYLSGMHLPMIFYLGATVPREWLSKCQAALPRPYWESLLYYTTVIALAFSFICLIAMAYLEGDRIIICCLRRHFEEQICAMKRQNVFNLGHQQNSNSTTEKCEKQKNSITEEKKLGNKPDPKMKKNDQSEPSHPPLYRRLVSLLIGLIKDRKLIRSTLFLSSSNNENDDDHARDSNNTSIDDVTDRLSPPPAPSILDSAPPPRMRNNTARKTFSNENDSEMDDAPPTSILYPNRRPVASTVIHFDYNNDESEAEAQPPSSKSRLRRRQTASSSTTTTTATLKDNNSRSAFKPIKPVPILPTRNDVRRSKTPENLVVRKVPTPVFPAEKSVSPIQFPSDESDDRLPEWENAYLPEMKSMENIDRDFDMLAYQTALFTSGYMNKNENENQITDRERLSIDKKLSPLSEEIRGNSDVATCINYYMRKAPPENGAIGKIAADNDFVENQTSNRRNGGKNPSRCINLDKIANSDLAARVEYSTSDPSPTLKTPAETISGAVARPSNFVDRLIPVEQIENPISEAIAAGLLSPDRPAPGGKISTAAAKKISPATAAAGVVKPSSSKLIQELRAEREKRLQEYRTKFLEEADEQRLKLAKETEEEWPGFNLDYRTALGNLWDDDYEPAKWLVDKVEPQQSVWSAPETLNRNSSTLTGAPRLFDLADTYSQRFTDRTATATTSALEGVRGWTPNDPTPFGSFFEQQVRRRSSNLQYSSSPVSISFGPPAPPQDSSILAWGPALPSENSITKLINTKHIWSDDKDSKSSSDFGNNSKIKNDE
uniref:Transmembrane protein 131-like conserved domain-containing protein n=1 Tax=Romanomermis culicivorax TaxID=13658 RepID=A0A915KZA5_ROMCU